MIKNSYELCYLNSVVPEAEQLLDLLILLALLLTARSLTAHSLTAHPLIAPLLENMGILFASVKQVSVIFLG
jgi:hypothetical protein